MATTPHDAPNGSTPERATATTGRKHTAGAFDIRNIIGMLLAIYGVILTVYSFSTAGQAPEKTGGVNANLWVGLALLVVGLVFMTWARLKPIVVPETAGDITPDDRPLAH